MNSEFMNKLLTCSDQEVHELIKQRIAELEKNAQNIEKIGSVERNTDSFDEEHFHGYISSKSKLCYALDEGYTMKATDYIYEYIDYIRKGKLSSGPNIVFNFINKYFGGVNESYDDYRDETLFKDISDFKGKGLAVCTERAALANNIMSFIGLDTYYCNGALENYANGEKDNHAFVILKLDDNNYRLYDPTYLEYDNNVAKPFYSKIDTEQAIKALNSKSSSDDNDKKISIPSADRTYGIGIFSGNLGKRL